MAKKPGAQYPRDVRYRDRMKAAGFAHVRVFVPRGCEAEIRERARQLRDEFNDGEPRRA